MAGLALAEGAPDYIWLALALAVLGGGISLASTVATDTVVTVVPRDRAGAASSISETGYELGIALGIAVLGSLLNAVYSASVPVPDGLRPELSSALTDSLAAATQALGSTHPDVLAAAQGAFTGAMQVTALVAAVIVGIAGLIAWRVLPSSKEAFQEVEH